MGIILTTIRYRLRKLNNSHNTEQRNAVPVPSRLNDSLSLAYFPKQITGGNFSGNKADFGGFMYRTGQGDTSCEGTSILAHESVDGGAIYAIDGATVHWACDIRDNSAISAAAM